MTFWALRIENRERLNPFLSQKMAILGIYLDMDNMDGIFIRIRINRIFPHPHGLAIPNWHPDIPVRFINHGGVDLLLDPRPPLVGPVVNDPYQGYYFWSWRELGVSL